MAESAGGWFEEASDHVAAHPEHGTIRLGPVVPIPGAELVPGILGWRRSIGSGRDGPPGASALFYLVGHPTGPRQGPSPLRGVEWSDFAVVVAFDRPTPGYILAQGPPARKAALVRFAGDVASELANLDD